jgi:UDP-glucose:(heptosyl)LPS alpha-1,3-glucosyltransferase
VTSEINSKMRIALLIDHYDPQGGGAERSAAQIVGELVRRGHRVTVLSRWGSGQEAVDGVTHRAYSPRKSKLSLSGLGFMRWARQALGVGGFDASLSMTMMASASVLQPRSGTVRETIDRNIAMRSTAGARAFKRALIGLSPKQQGMLAMERRTLRDPSVKKVVAISRYVVDQLRRHYRVDGSRVELIPNAAEMPLASQEEVKGWREQVRRHYKIEPEATVYLFAALNPRMKGGHELLYATQRLFARGQKPVVLLAGRVDYAMQHLAALLGVRGQVRFVGTTNQMVKLYAAADVTVHPTFYDPSSKVVIESLMMGVPAISTAYNGASDMIVDSGAGYVRGRVIADPSDIEGLAGAMSELSDERERGRCIASMRGLRESLSMSCHVDRLERVLAGVSERQPRSVSGSVAF